MLKWLRKVRALPSESSSDDHLKIEYVEVNLNNSRKLIGLLSKVAVEAKTVSTQQQELVASLLPIRSMRNELAWLDSVGQEN